jgi:hypothetical protein
MDTTLLVVVSFLFKRLHEINSSVRDIVLFTFSPNEEKCLKAREEVNPKRE